MHLSRLAPSAAPLTITFVPPSMSLTDQLLVEHAVLLCGSTSGGFEEGLVNFPQSNVCSGEHGMASVGPQIGKHNCGGGTTMQKK